MTATPPPADTPPPSGGQPPAGSEPAAAPTPPAAAPPPPGAAAPTPAPTPAPPAWGQASGHGRVSPGRLIAVFVGVLAVALVATAAIAVATTPPPPAPACPDPTQACGAPPVAESLPPNANASPTAAPTPKPTIVRPAGTVPPSAPTAPSPAPSAALSPSASPSASSGSTAPQNPSVIPITGLPSPSPASSAGAFAGGTVWTSATYGYSLVYDDRTWVVEREDAGSVILSAGNGLLVVFVEGFPAKNGQPSQLVQSGVDDLQDLVLGLADEDDPGRQLPGQPIIGYAPGVAAVMNGTLNSPQGPTADVSVVVIASTEGAISIRAQVIVDQRVRDRGFSVADSLLNSISWPEPAQ